MLVDVARLVPEDDSGDPASQNGGRGVTGDAGIEADDVELAPAGDIVEEDELPAEDEDVS